MSDKQMLVELYRSTYTIAQLVERLAYLASLRTSVDELRAGGAKPCIIDQSIALIQVDVDAVTEARALLTFESM